MTIRRYIPILITLFILIFIRTGSVFAQAPNISYSSPQNYILNTTITPLAPANTGGAVPAAIYAQISTIAGNGLSGSANGIGNAASFYNPVGLAIDKSGNLYVCDTYNNLIRKIAPGGVVTTLAGSGLQGSANGVGILASFNQPTGIAIDSFGNLYIADSGNNIIRKISPNGTVSTFAGSGSLGFNDGIGILANFSDPFALAADAANNIYVADTGNNLIRMITPGGVVSTLAGHKPGGYVNAQGTAAAFDGPLSVAVDNTGNVYVMDEANACIRKITPLGVVTTFAGNGAQGPLSTLLPQGALTLDNLGNLYIADEDNNQIEKITPAGVSTVVAGSGVKGFSDGISTSATFFSPQYIISDNSGNLYISDAGNHAIRKLSMGGYTIDKTLPPGLSFNPATGIISGTPTVASPATIYTITAYNGGGSSTTTVNIAVIDEATIAFGPIPTKTFCDPNFDPGATGNGTITYTSSNTSVATIVAGKIHITGAGTAVITASDSYSQSAQILTVSPAQIPTISISPNFPDNCQDAAVTYTATITNGGTNPVYQWQINGQNTGTNSPQFTSSNLNNNDKITCILTSNAICITSATVTSNASTFIIDPPVSTSVSITLSESGPICKGTQVTFIATATTPDVNPIYQWQVNGQNSGTNSAVFTSTNLADGDIVTCILASTGKCLVNPGAVSNAITISLSPASTCLIVIPNTFTPNGDGINDLWDITALVSYPYCTVKIFDRYGALVYNSTGYPKAWDGTYNGKPLPIGTYYYIIDPKNGMKKFAGPVTILR